MNRTKAEVKALQLEMNIAPDTPVHLHGDEVRIRQIITNLLTNAVKYTKQGKITVTVSGKRMSQGKVQLYVSVRDTGIGIRQEDIGRLFESFQRVEESRNRNIEGTGLGLSITTHLLNLMGSWLQVKSTYGEGSDFYFYLEQQQTDDQVIGENVHTYYHSIKGLSEMESKGFYAPEAKLLVVDDNAMNLKVFQGLLKNYGMQIDTAMSGRECLEMMTKKAYHIIFMDHLMPDMDGVETLKQTALLQNNLSRDAVIIILTANAVSGAREMFLREGFRDYLTKPVSLPKLEEMILKYLPKELVEKENAHGAEEKAEYIEKYAPVSGDVKKADLVDWEKGRALCANNEAFFRELLGVFTETKHDLELERYLKEEDFENYRIKVHATKTNLANIGATEASEMAKKLELSIKTDNNIDYVREHHREFISVYRQVVETVKTYLSAP